jgi:hypothetical protein
MGVNFSHKKELIEKLNVCIDRKNHLTTTIIGNNSLPELRLKGSVRKLFPMVVDKVIDKSLLCSMLI